MKNWILIAVCSAASIVLYQVIFPVTALIIVVTTPFLPEGWYGLNIFAPFIVYFLIFFSGIKIKMWWKNRKNRGMYMLSV
jgi:hypothetical protein